MRLDQTNKYFYTRTKSVKPGENGKENLRLFASLIIETYLPYGDFDRRKIKIITSKTYIHSFEYSPLSYKKLPSGIILEEIPHSKFCVLADSAENDIPSFFLFS